MFILSIFFDIIAIVTFLEIDFSFIIFTISNITLLNSIIISVFLNFLLIPILFLNMVKFRLINNLTYINYSSSISIGLLFITYCYLYLNKESTFFIGLFIFSLLISRTFFSKTIFGQELIQETKNSTNLITNNENTTDVSNEGSISDVKLSEKLLNLHIIDSYYSDDFSKCIYYCNLSIKNFGNNDISLTKRAECLENLGYYLNAIKDYELHLEINGKDPNINGLIGTLYFKIGFVELAKKNLLIAINGGYNFYSPTYQFANIDSENENVLNFIFEKKKNAGLHDLIDLSIFSLLDDVRLNTIEIAAKRAIKSLEKKKSENNSNVELYEMMINYVKSNS